MSKKQKKSSSAVAWIILSVALFAVAWMAFGQFAQECEHVYEDGVCIECGADECDHVFDDGNCTECGAEECDHVYEDGVCTECGADEVSDEVVGDETDESQAD